MSDLRQFFGPNAGLVIELYEQYQADPNSVDAATRAYFANFTPDLPKTPESSSTPEVRDTTFAPASSTMSRPGDIQKIVGTARLCRMIRETGHTAASIDPLGKEPKGDPDLEMSTHEISADDLKRLPALVVGGPLAEGASNALEAVARLRSCYCGNVGYETDHSQITDERNWLYEAIESRRFFTHFGNERMRWILETLTEVDTFEPFLQRVYATLKRFTLE